MRRSRERIIGVFDYLIFAGDINGRICWVR